MKKVVLMLVMVFSFTFVASASNTVEKFNLTPKAKKEILKKEVDKKPESMRMVTVYCGDGSVWSVSCSSCSWGELLDVAWGIC